MKDEYDFSGDVQGKRAGRLAKSNCCNAPVRVEGGRREDTTHFYVCVQCGKACDLKPEGGEEREHTTW